MPRADALFGDRWEAVDRVLEEALDREEPERSAWLQDRCGDDVELREHVRSLLDAVIESEGRFEAPGVAAAREALVDLASRADPQAARIGDYDVIDEIGRGGMGTVYKGVRDGDGFRQVVALKVLRRGLDTDDILRRFRTERRVLASLTHPNIARLYDGGTSSDGRPYLAMEYVEGTTLTAHCDAARLTVRARLELLLHVVDAVSAAHAQLIVHRDLKPSNILVNPDGHVKLLDFGIAKLLDADEPVNHTRTGVHVLTPEYASPEQLRGQPVTTATDVYQLGVLLFELLTGRLPHAGPPHIGADEGGLRDAPRPSAVIERDAGHDAIALARSTTVDRLKATLRGDLETIVLKALSPEPARRYGSAEQLAEDIRRFLDDRPIAARPASRWYRARKFAARHPWVAPAAALALAVIAAYVVLTARHAAQLEAERNLARLESERADEVRAFLVDLFRSADPSLPADAARGRRITVVEALDIGAERLKTELQDRPEVRASLLSALSEVYANLGLHDRARPLREEALSIETALYGEASAPVRASLGQLGRLLGHLGEPDQAQAHLDTHLALARAAGPAAIPEVADGLLALGQLYVATGRPDDGKRQFEAVIALATTGDVPVAQLAEAHRSMADVHSTLDRVDLAEASARQALALTQQALGETAVGVGSAHVTLGQKLGALGRLAEAERHFDAGLAILEDRLGDSHWMTLNSLNNLAVLRQKAADLAGAEALHRRVLEIRTRTGAPELQLAGSYQNLATIVGLQGRHDEAVALHLKARDLYRDAARPGSYFPALPNLSLAGLYLKRARPADAEAAAREAQTIVVKALPAGHYITAVAECRLAQAMVARGQGAAAEPLFDRATAALLKTTSVPEYRDECIDAALALYDRLGGADKAFALRRAHGGS
jgi:tetratricopeptide (TPR) repeat protein/tRNA A-37 threonylcarbamoyl transferase component Bud32